MAHGTTKFTMGYWQMRGLGAAIRMMLHYGVGEEQFEDVQFTQDNEGLGNWFSSLKPKMIKEKNVLANIPYLIDHSEDDKTVVHFNSICLYLGNKFGIDAGDVGSEQFLRNMQILNEVMDIRNQVIRLVYTFPNATRTKEEFDEALPKHLEATKKTFEKLEAWLNFHGSKYFEKDTISSCDFHAFEMIDQHEYYRTLLKSDDKNVSMLESFPRLKKFWEDVKNEPKLTSYFNSKEYLEFDMNNHRLAKTWCGPSRNGGKY